MQEEADDIPMVVEEDIQRALEDESSSSQSSSSQSSNMEEAETWRVEVAIKSALLDESATTLHIESYYDPWDDEDDEGPPPLTIIDSQCIIECLRQTPRVDTLEIYRYSLHDDAVLNVLRDGLPLCTSITTVTLNDTKLGNEDLDLLRPAFYNTSITRLYLTENVIQGRRRGEVLRDLLVGNDTLRELILNGHRLGPEVAIGFGQGLADNHGLQILNLEECHIGNEGLEHLVAAVEVTSNNSLTNLYLRENGIQGVDGGRQVSLLLQRFSALKVLDLDDNRVGPMGARALAPGLATARHLEMLNLASCGLGNDGMANLVPDGQVNKSLADLYLIHNNIEGAEGGRQVSLLLQHFPKLKVLHISHNRLGPLGANAFAPGLAVASHLESLELCNCYLGNDGVANLVPDGQVNRTLTYLNLGYNNCIRGIEGVENVIALASRCTYLDSIDVYHYPSLDQQHRLDMVLDQNRLCKEASALGGSPFSILFRFVEKAHRHEHGLSAIFLILQNDGDDYFCTANKRAIEYQPPNLEWQSHWSSRYNHQTWTRFGR